MTREFGSDFGRSHFIPPAEVVREGPDGTAEDLLRRAAASGRDMAVRGAGRSCNTQTLTRGTVLHTLGGDAAPRFTGTEDLVEVPSGITWYELETWLNGHGRANPVLPSFLDLTVGGTLSIGGFGLGSVRSGLQIDQVREIELVDGTGRALRCSAGGNAELFRYALGGLGQVGFLRKAVLRTVPYRATSRVSRVAHSGLADLVAFMPDIAREPGVSGYFGMYDRSDWYSQVSWAADAAPRPGEQPVPDYPVLLHREVGRHLSPLLHGDVHANLWADYVLDEAGLHVFAAALEELLDAYPLTETLISLYFLVIERPRPATPFVFAPVLDTPVHYGVGVFASAPRSDDRAVSGTRRVQRRLLETCASAGGRPYLYGAHAFDADLLHAFYGAPALRRLAELRDRHALTHFNRRAFGGVRP
ncbi:MULTISPECIES: FAD-binding protein [Streptomyces]|uniref:FAD-binding protein n=1 Tax=Streptomyces TaxID=1883 RepID=UPI00163CD235|nr:MULTISPECIES: FAD-binding protein [Streptomyces]MBC2879662.1 FAD-binding protein [Streptomyces sp. TYQ1024]UBI35089.1 FAD-binding protein [Streptomyces mobaraensis]UKW27682.1 FAD-binding protein [Streptomyces sp. TYQ1024]